MPRLLELFSGTGSVGRAFAAQGWDVDSVDLEMPATWQMDVLDWERTAMRDPGLPHYDCIWASPPCTHYSRSRTTAKTPRNLELADELVRCTIRIIDELQPRFWYMENPQTGLLKDRDVVARLPFRDASYCMYGLPYRKQTRIWTSEAEEWIPRTCDGKNGCGQMEGRRHMTTAESRSGFTREELYRIPAALCDEVATWCTDRLGGGARAAAPDQ